jgi:hypothetical protein
MIDCLLHSGYLEYYDMELQKLLKVSIFTGLFWHHSGRRRGIPSTTADGGEHLGYVFTYTDVIMLFLEPQESPHKVNAYACFTLSIQVWAVISGTNMDKCLCHLNSKPEVQESFYFMSLWYEAQASTKTIGMIMLFCWKSDVLINLTSSFQIV